MSLIPLWLPPLTHEQEVARAKAMLDRLPPVPEIYWHSADGIPCSCSSCCLAATRLLAVEIDEYFRTKKFVRRFAA